MNTKFRISKPLSENKTQEAKADVFVSGADNTNFDNLDPNSKPTTSFTVPLNEYELNLLRKVAELDDRSMRKVSRKLFVKVLKEFLE